jgi:transporter family-2 protein
MANLLLATLLTLAAGASLVLQQALNVYLRAALNSAAWAGFVSYVGGLLCMALLLTALRDPIPAGAVARIPWWAWSGGLFGALYIGLAIVLVPQLGTATFVALLLAGQMLASVAFDHYGAFGLEVLPNVGDGRGQAATA